MVSRSQRTKQRDVALSALDGFIQALKVAEEACDVPTAQIALTAACILLSAIKVRSHLSLNDELLIHVYLEHDEKPR